jgi:hypothetical protein
VIHPISSGGVILVMISIGVIITLGVVPGIVGALLAYRYSAFALVPAALFFLVLAIAGCRADGLSLSEGALVVLFDLTCLQVGYFLGLFVQQTRRRLAATSFGLDGAPQDERPRRPFIGQRRNVRPSVPSRVEPMN